MCNSFFFFKQKTAYEMRISDWSSDVCSSDLSQVVAEAHDVAMLPAAIIEVMLPIVVAKDKLVDRLRAIVEGIDQRLADGVLERPLGTVADRDADAAELVVRLDVVGAEEEIILDRKSTRMNSSP